MPRMTDEEAEALDELVLEQAGAARIIDTPGEMRELLGIN